MWSDIDASGNSFFDADKDHNRIHRPECRLHSSGSVSSVVSEFMAEERFVCGKPEVPRLPQWDKPEAGESCAPCRDYDELAAIFLGLGRSLHRDGQPRSSILGGFLGRRRRVGQRHQHSIRHFCAIVGVRVVSNDVEHWPIGTDGSRRGLRESIRVPSVISGFMEEDRLLCCRPEVLRRGQQVTSPETGQPCACRGERKEPAAILLGLCRQLHGASRLRPSILEGILAR